jgi:hypothetical protein
MVASWMLYAAAVAALLAAAAAAVDRALRAGGRPTRLVWLASLLASLAVPAAAPWRPAAAPSPTIAVPAPPAASGGSGDWARARRLGLTALAPRDDVPARERWAALDRPLLAAWGASSAAVLGWLLLSHRALRRRRRRWRADAVLGAPVLVSPDMGPAIVGVVRPRIVLPAWALALDGDRLALMLAHEGEHARARDPIVLAAATVAAALVPWSPAAWWQLARLRLAVEVDCDRRVLRRHPDTHTYGALLVDVAERARSGAPASRLVAAALAAPITSLERRIRIMTSRPPRRAALRAASLAAVAAALLVVACRAPRPALPLAFGRAPVAEASTAGPPAPSVAPAPPRSVAVATAPAAPATSAPAVAREDAPAPPPPIVEPAQPPQPAQERPEDRRLAVVVLGAAGTEESRAAQRQLVTALAGLIEPAGSPRVIPSADIEAVVTAAGFTQLTVPDLRSLGRLVRAGAALGVTIDARDGRVRLAPVLLYPGDSTAARTLPAAEGSDVAAATQALARQLVAAGDVRAPLRARPR